jgi:hypothetical protein
MVRKLISAVAGYSCPPRAFGKTDRAGVARPVLENDAARIWRGLCASAELERQADRKRFFWRVSNSLLQAPSLYFRSKTFAAHGSAQCQISRLPSMSN